MSISLKGEVRQGENWWERNSKGEELGKRWMTNRDADEGERKEVME